jgi:hypothetical protein
MSGYHACITAHMLGACRRQATMLFYAQSVTTHQIPSGSISVSLFPPRDCTYVKTLFPKPYLRHICTNNTIFPFENGAAKDPYLIFIPSNHVSIHAAHLIVPTHPYLRLHQIDSHLHYHTHFLFGSGYGLANFHRPRGP